MGKKEFSFETTWIKTIYQTTVLNIKSLGTKYIFKWLKARNHLFGQFLNVPIYITNKTYILPI